MNSGRTRRWTRSLPSKHVTVPTMLVHSLWDQEDIYGNIALYKALKAQQADTSNIYLVIGPWFHHQQRLDGSAIGQIRFGSDTAEYFRKHLVRPFFDHYLKDDAPPLGLAQVTAFETGTNRWQQLATWPSGCNSGCSIHDAKTISAKRRRSALGRGSGGAPRGGRRRISIPTCRIRPSPCPIFRGPCISAAMKARAGRPGW